MRDRCCLQLLILLFPICGHAQYTWGLLCSLHEHYGGNGFANEDRGIKKLKSFSVGVLTTDIRAGFWRSSHWSGSLSWQRRTCDYFGPSADPNSRYWADMEIRTDQLELTVAARIPFSVRSRFTFDVEPVIDWRFAQERNGIAYTRDFMPNDTIRLDHDRSVDRNFSGGRLRTGISCDLPVVSGILLHAALRLGWGVDDWPPGGTRSSFDWTVRVGVHRSFGPLVTITPVWE